MTAAVRPFRLIPGSILSSLQTELSDALKGWAGQWGVCDNDFALSLQPFVPRGKTVASRAEYLHFRAGEAQAWAAVSRQALRNLHTAMFGAQHSLACADREEDYSWEAVQQARAQLLGDIIFICARANPGEASTTDTLPDSLLIAGTGALEISVGLIGLQMIVSGSSFQAPASKEPKAANAVPVSITDIVKDQPVRLDVLAGTADIELINLLELAPGDVILLDACVDEPLQLLGPADTPIGRCALGQSAGHRAIQIAP